MSSETSVASDPLLSGQPGPSDSRGRTSAALAASPVVISLSLAGVTRLLVSCVLVLGVVGFAVQLDKFVLGATINDNIVDKLSLIGEATIPGWYSSMTLMYCAVLLAVIAVAKRAANDRFRLHWAFLSLTFLALSLDESAAFHELSVRPIRDFFDAGGIFYHAWVIPALILVPLFGLAYLVFLRSLPRSTAYLFVGAAVLYVGGALGMEMLEGHYFDTYGRKDLGYMYYVQVEEMSEMLGVVVFIYALLRYVRDHLGATQITIR